MDTSIYSLTFLTFVQLEDSNKNCNQQAESYISQAVHTTQMPSQVVSNLKSDSMLFARRPLSVWPRKRKDMLTVIATYSTLRLVEGLQNALFAFCQGLPFKDVKAPTPV